MGSSVQTYIKTHTYHGNAKSNRVCAWLHVTCNSDTVMEGRGRVQPWILAMEKQKQWVSYKVQARLVRGVHSNILSQKWTKKSVWSIFRYIPHCYDSAIMSQSRLYNLQTGSHYHSLLSPVSAENGEDGWATPHRGCVFAALGELTSLVYPVTVTEQN